VIASIVIVSPGATLNTGGSVASRYPQKQVSGVAANRMLLIVVRR
jgi:hypothetical protein